MPVLNGSGRLSIGRDCTLVVIGPYGRIDLPNVMGFEAKQVTSNIKVDRLDGVQLNAELPKGWEGSFENERGNSGLDDAFAEMETAWFEGGTVGVGTIYQYIMEADGSQTTYQFDNVSMKLDDAGSWKGDASVKQRVSFNANRRRRV